MACCESCYRALIQVSFLVMHITIVKVAAGNSTFRIGSKYVKRMRLPAFSLQRTERQSSFYSALVHLYLSGISQEIAQELIVELRKRNFVFVHAIPQNIPYPGRGYPNIHATIRKSNPNKLG